VSDPDPDAEIAGWFGKIPAHGDFVTRRLPPTFVDPWDAWLSAELVAAQRTLDDTWLSTYRHAAIWRFALMAGVIDRGRWYGVWIPSFDRVGRQFPLTIALGSQSSTDAPQRWWAALLATGLRALEPTCDADGVDAALGVFLGNRGAPEDSAEPFERIAPVLASTGEGSSLWWPWFAGNPGSAAAWTFDGLPRGDDFLKLLRTR
jgi:type VI secretion system protein ImpM